MAVKESKNAQTPKTSEEQDGNLIFWFIGIGVFYVLVMIASIFVEGSFHILYSASALLFGAFYAIGVGIVLAIIVYALFKKLSKISIILLTILALIIGNCFSFPAHAHYRVHSSDSLGQCEAYECGNEAHYYINGLERVAISGQYCDEHKDYAWDDLDEYAGIRKSTRKNQKQDSAEDAIEKENQEWASDVKDYIDNN